jgi:hypothetical protein
MISLTHMGSSFMPNINLKLLLKMQVGHYNYPEVKTKWIASYASSVKAIY